MRCLADSSCSYLSYACSADSDCRLQCTGPGSCAYLPGGLPGVQATFSNVSVYGSFNLTSVLGALSAKSFARIGYEMYNFVFTADYRMQILCLGVPEDNATLELFLENLTKAVSEELDATKYPSWTHPPPFILKKTYPYILTMSYDYVQMLGWVFKVYLDYSYPGLSRFVKPHSAVLDEAASTIYVEYDTLFNFTPFFGPFRSGLTSLLLALFKYPNSTFINVELYQPNNTYLKTTLLLYPYHCKSPSTQLLSI